MRNESIEVFWKIVDSVAKGNKELPARRRLKFVFFVF
jgi:hypothetical protein